MSFSQRRYSYRRPRSIWGSGHGRISLPQQHPPRIYRGTEQNFRKYKINFWNHCGRSHRRPQQLNNLNHSQERRFSRFTHAKGNYELMQNNTRTRPVKFVNQPITRNAKEREFIALVKRFYELLRAQHHLERVAGDSGHMPPTLSRLIRYLTSVLKPARLTGTTRARLEENAKNWARTSLLILKDHYESIVGNGLDELIDCVIPAWGTPFDVASKWYRIRYKNRHDPQTIKNTKILITTLCDEPAEGNRDAVETFSTSSGDGTLEDFPPLIRAAEPLAKPPALDTSLTPLEKRQRQKRKPRKKIKKTKHSPLKNQNTESLDNPAAPTDYNSNTENSDTNIVTSITQIESQNTPSLEQTAPTVFDATNTCQNNQGTDEDPQPTVSSIITEETQAEIEQVKEKNQTGDNDNFQNQPKSPTVINTFPVIQHIHTMRKLSDWRFKAHKKCCILGDSNLARIETHEIKDLQIDSYPGATFRNAEAVISKAEIHTKVEKIVLAFGINHRNQKCQETAIKQVQKALKVTKEKFPKATVFIPLINYSDQLDAEEQQNLADLNAHIKRNMVHLPQLPKSKFQVNRDKIHWTPECAIAMKKHWYRCLNLKAL